MITINATNLRTNLFEILEKVSQGEPIVITRNNQQVAKLIPYCNKKDWREGIENELIFKSSPDELINIDVAEEFKEYL